MQPALDRAAWSTAVPDWADRIRARRTLVPELPLFNSEAERALRVFKRLRVPDIEGFPTYGEVCASWVFDLVRALFGSYDPKLKRRMLREFFVLIPKKNGKSSIAAAIIVTAAIVNARPAAELLLIAPTKKIADIAFKQAAGIVRLDAELNKLFHLQVHQRTITHRVTDAQILVKAADADVITGSKATYILVDETHEFAKKSNASDVFVEIRGSLAARPDGFMLQITTQSKTPPTGVFKNELNIARAVRDGELSLPLLAVLYELPPDLAVNDNWRNPETWGLVNPNLGLSVDPEFLADEILKADREGPEKLQLIASQHFNVEIGVGLRTDHWPGARLWPARSDKTLTLDALLRRSEVVVAGVDGGGADDLFGLALIGRCRQTKRWLHWARAWCHAHVLDLRKEIAPRLLELKVAGDLVVCQDPEANQDVAEITAILQRVNRRGLFPAKGAVGLDAHGVTVLVDALVKGEDGLTDDQLASVSQGYKLNGVILGVERKLMDGSFVHGGTELMAWVVGNAKVEQRGNAVLVTKQASGKAKIDPLMATFDAADMMSRNPDAAGAIDIDGFIRAAVMGA